LKNKTDRRPICPEHDVPMQIKRSRFGPFWSCPEWPECEFLVGCHPDGRPLGIPADRKGRQWRTRAHTAFDRLWKSTRQSGEGLMARPSAYIWMRKELNLTTDEAHIAEFGVEQCKQLIEAVEKYLSRRNTRE
jgi:ssDNA-binding Zn-finger/Zn-ribbon topoisomerase 1